MDEEVSKRVLRCTVMWRPANGIEVIDEPFKAVSIRIIEGFLRFADADDCLVKLYSTNAVVWVDAVRA